MVPLARVMQQEGLTPSEDPGALKVTISKFYLPSGKSTQLEGVKSDIVLPSLSDALEVGEIELENPLPWDTIRGLDLAGDGSRRTLPRRACAPAPRSASRRMRTSPRCRRTASRSARIARPSPSR